MQIQLCKKSLESQGAKMPVLVAGLTDREHTIVVKDCLNRCQGCQLGLIIAIADGMPMSAKNPEKFLADLDELAEES
jgi:hypothetical protein